MGDLFNYSKQVNLDIANICLIKNEKNKIVPVLLILKKSENQYFAFHLVSSVRNSKNAFHIGQPEGFKYDSYLNITRLFTVHIDDIVKFVACANQNLIECVIKKRKQFVEISKLHEKVHILKKKISLAQFNNERYSKLEKELDCTLKKLGYKPSHTRIQREHGSKKFRNFREIPNNGYIKVYLGGR